MKKILLFISAIAIGSSTFAQWQGFENWTQNNVQTLDNYKTTVNDWGLEGATVAYSVNDAITGSLSIKLETKLTSFGDTIFGYFLSGDPDIPSPGQAVTLPVPGAIDSIIGWYKCDILAGDSATLLIMPTALSTPTGGGAYYFSSQQQTTWKRFAFEVNAAASDSILLAGATGDPLNNFYGKPGSWIQFEDIQLKGPGGTANVVNYSFENWSNVSWEDLAYWQTGNRWSIGEPTLPVTKTTDKNSGTYAIELTNILSVNNSGDTLRGIATNGVFGNSGAVGGEPFSGTASAVECYYKFAPASGDNASINFEFRQNGSIVGNYGVSCTTTSTYTLWNQALPVFTPDTVLITIWGGNKIGSVLKVDDINFVFPVGISENITIDRLVSYPNPATDIIKLRFNIVNDNNVTIKLIDITGKELTSRSLGHLTSGTYQESFNTSKFTSGIYFIEFTLDDEKIVKQFVVK
jgi:hypothetical protein